MSGRLGAAAEARGGHHARRGAGLLPAGGARQAAAPRGPASADQLGFP